MGDLAPEVNAWLREHLAEMLGVDIGGTFTDFAWARTDGTLVVAKLPTTPEDPARAFLQGLAALGVPPAEELVHGCTVAINAILEGKGARTALVATRGFADVLEIGRQTRLDLYDLHVRRPPPLVPRDLRFEVPERVDATGQVLQPLDDEAAVEVGRRVREMGVESVAVSLLFSFLRPEHEERVEAALRRAGFRGPVSLSSRVLPEFREYERTSTTVLNAYVAPVIASYLHRLQQAVPNPLRVMSSSGGSLTVSQALEGPVQTLLNGPAGGALGGLAVARAAGFDRVITLDMGGTSTDVSLCPGHLQETAEGTISGHPIRVPAVDIQTVGAGGGSIARLDTGGALAVGPESAGARPGPAAYGLGTLPTVTDADIVLGRLPGHLPLGGSVLLRPQAAWAALEALGAAMRTGAVAAARGVVRVADSNMERALRRVSVEGGFDPRDFTLVAFGGAGPLHACGLAEALGIPRVLVPRYPGVLSALGMLLADLVRTYARTVMLDGAEATAEQVAALLAPLEEQARADLLAAGFGGERVSLGPAADLRYRGQGYEVTVPVHADDGLGLLDRFHAAHLRHYGHSHPDWPVELVTVRLRATGRVHSPALPQGVEEGPDSGAALLGRAGLAEERGAIQAPLYARERLRPGNRIAGPCVVAQADATTYLPVGWLGRVDTFFNLVLEPS